MTDPPRRGQLSLLMAFLPEIRRLVAKLVAKFCVTLSLFMSVTLWRSQTQAQ